jgi:hypothetical protein
MLSILLLLAVAPPAERVAVYDIQADTALGDRVGPVLTSSIVAEVRKLRGLSVIGMDEVRAMLDLEAQKQLVGCADDSCLAEIAAALGVDTVLVGSIARVGDQHFFGLRRIQQTSATVKGQVNQRLERGNGEEFLGVVGPAIEALFPERELKPGARRGVAPELAVRLNPPPLDPWVFWTGIGVSGAAMAASTVVTVLFTSTASAFDTVNRSGGDAGERERLLQEATALQTATIASWATTAVLTVATASTAGFVDWRGYRSAVQLETVE